MESYLQRGLTQKTIVFFAVVQMLRSYKKQLGYPIQLIWEGDSHRIRQGCHHKMLLVRHLCFVNAREKEKYSLKGIRDKNKIPIRCKQDRRENTKVKKMLKREQLGTKKNRDNKELLSCSKKKMFLAVNDV